MADTANKDTIYVDVDDEITAIIDKLRGSQARLVALVLPKRATVLQSIVNMKLLKRSAEQAKKQLVLITTEPGLLPLAGSVGLHVADSLQSKPAIPDSPNLIGSAMEEDSLSLEDEPETAYTADNAADKPVGDLAKKAGTGLAITSGVAVEGLDDTTDAAAVPKVPPVAKPVGKPNKKLRVPNFNKFRLRLIIAIVAVLLLIGFVLLAIFVLPKATIAIGTNAEDINSSLGVQLDTTASHVDVANGVVPAQVVSQDKTYTEQVDATGKENKGNTAAGTITMTTCANNMNQLESVPAGTGVSNGSNTYITQDTATFTYNNNGQCSSGIPFSSDAVAITAQKPGASYNVDPGSSFTVNGRSDVSATGSASGGTDDIQQVVTQGDIDNAQGKINTKDDSVRSALSQQLKQNNLFPVSATFTASKPKITTSSKPGDEATTVTVTASVTYTMFGTKRSNLVALIKDDISQQVDLSHQGIINDGLDSATFSVRNQSATVANLTLENTATVGPNIDQSKIKQQVAGMKAGEAKQLIQQISGVNTVDVNLSPFWVGHIPSSPSKIVITIHKSGAQNQ